MHGLCSQLSTPQASSSLWRMGHQEVSERVEAGPALVPRPTTCLLDTLGCPGLHICCGSCHPRSPLHLQTPLGQQRTLSCIELRTSPEVPALWTPLKTKALSLQFYCASEGSWPLGVPTLVVDMVSVFLWPGQHQAPQQCLRPWLRFYPAILGHSVVQGVQVRLRTLYWAPKRSQEVLGVCCG